MAVDSKIFELLVATVKDYAVFVLDPRGHILSWNAGAQELKGYEPDEIIGQHFSTFYTDEAKRRGWPDYELRVAATQGRFEDEGWRVRKDGSRFWANVIITALRDAKGELLGFSKITRDLTARRSQEELLRQSEERFRLLIEGVVDFAIYMLDVEGRITSWNPGAQRIKGFTRDEVLGKHFSLFYLAEDIEAGVPWKELAVVRARGHLESEGWRVRKNGARFFARTVVNALYDSEGHLKGFAKVTQDLSARQYAQQLERTTQHMTEFIAILAHELRNPLAPIKNALAVMERSPREADLQAAMRGTIARQTTHLNKLVDDMLDISRVSTGTLAIEPKPVDIKDLVQRVVEDISILARPVGQTVLMDLPPENLFVDGDYHRLNQLLVNILTNAVRFTADQGTIRVSARSTNGQIAVVVSDTGRGIAQEDLPGIFAMFVRGKEALHRLGGGLGVGLALSRRIAELHGGTIEARSAGLGHGSEFTVRLPALKEHSVALQAVTASAAPSEGLIPKRVLVVDDNRDAAFVLDALLQSLGHITQVAYDGPTALAVAGEFRPQIVLLDIGMPGMNGYEVARRLRARKDLRLKIIAVTGWGSAEDRARSADAGFDKHLVKPVDERELLQVLLNNGVTTH